MRRWDLLLVAAICLVTVAAVGVDWRLGTCLLGLALGGVWYWLGDAGEDG